MPYKLLTVSGRRRKELYRCIYFARLFSGRRRKELYRCIYFARLFSGMNL